MHQCEHCILGCTTDHTSSSSTALIYRLGRHAALQRWSQPSCTTYDIVSSKLGTSAVGRARKAPCRLLTHLTGCCSRCFCEVQCLECPLYRRVQSIAQLQALSAVRWCWIAPSLTSMTYATLRQLLNALSDNADSIELRVLLLHVGVMRRSIFYTWSTRRSIMRRLVL